MKYRTPLCLLIVFSLLFVTAWPALAASSPWEAVAPGIEYQRFLLPDPNRVYVARMERSNPSVTLESGLAKGTLTTERETVLDMANRYDQTLSFWDPSWGRRNRVAVAINGSYLDRLTGLILSGQVQNGIFVKRFDPLGGGSGFGWTYDRQAFIGRCVDYDPGAQIVVIPATETTLRLNGVNVPREEDTLVLYTPQFNARTGTNDSGAEVVIELDRLMMNQYAPGGLVGYVRKVRDGVGSSAIPFDHVVLSGHGAAREALLASLQVGDEVHIMQGIQSLEEDCLTPLDLSWSRTYTSISGAYAYLRNGEIFQMDDPGATYRHPRTAIAFNDQYIYFIVVDGRQPGVSVGMSFDELAAFSRDELGATWGVAQDGGGSSTMVINGKVVNQPVSSCPNGYNYTYVPLVRNGSQLASLENLDHVGRFLPIRAGIDRCQRAVGNAIFMVELEPMQRSDALDPFDIVRTVRPADVYLGPGTNYANVFTIDPGSEAVVLHHFNDLHGVLAKGTYWWKIAFDGLEGWVAEDTLEYVRTPPQGAPPLN